MAMGIRSGTNNACCTAVIKEKKSGISTIYSYLTETAYHHENGAAHRLDTGFYKFTRAVLHKPHKISV
jgi:hypothetical protein